MEKVDKLNYFETVIIKNISRFEFDVLIENDDDEYIDLLNVYKNGLLTEENLEIFEKDCIDGLKDQLIFLLDYNSQDKELQSKLGIVYEYVTSCIEKANFKKIITALVEQELKTRQFFDMKPNTSILNNRKHKKELQKILKEALNEIDKNIPNEKEFKKYAQNLSSDLIMYILANHIPSSTFRIAKQFLKDLYEDKGEESHE